MKTSLFGIPVIFIDLLAGLIFLFLILVTAAQFNFRLATQGQTHGASPNESTAETRKLRATNAELAAQLRLKEGQLQGIQADNALLTANSAAQGVDTANLDQNKQALAGKIQEQETKILTLTEDRAVLMSQLNRRNREMNRLLQGALTLRGEQAESEQTRALLQEKTTLTQRLLEEEDALLRLKQENERLTALQADQSIQAEEKKRLSERFAAQERELTALKLDRSSLVTSQETLKVRENEKKQLMERIEKLDSEMLRLRREHAGVADAQKELQAMGREKQSLVTQLAQMDQQSAVLRQEMAQKNKPTTQANTLAGLAELQGEVANLTARSATQERRLQSLEQEKSALSEGIRQRDMELATLRTDTTQAVEAMQQIDPKELSTQLAARQSEIKVLQEENARLAKTRQEQESLEQEKKRLLATIDGRDAQLEQLRAEIGRLAAGAEEATRTTAGIQKARKELETQLRERDERIVELKKEGHILAAKSGAEDVLKSLHQEKEELLDWIRRDEDEIGRLKQENANLASLAGQTGGNQTGEVESPRELFRELTQLKEQLRKQGTEVTALLDDKETLQQRILQMTTDVQSLRQNPEQTKAPLAALQKERDELQAQIKQRDSSIQQLQRENTALAANKSSDETVRALQSEQGELKELLTRRSFELDLLKRENATLKAATSTPLPVRRHADTGADEQPKTLEDLIAQLDANDSPPVTSLPVNNTHQAGTAAEASKNTQQASVAPKPPKNRLPAESAPEAPKNTQQASVAPKPPKNALPAESAPEAPKNTQQAGIAPKPPKNALPAEAAPEAPKNTQQAEIASKPPKNVLPAESAPEPNNFQLDETEPTSNVSQHQGWLQSVRAWMTSKFEPSQSIQTNALPAESAPEASKNIQQAGVAPKPPKNALPAESAPEAPKNTQQAGVAPKPPKNVLPDETAPESPKNTQQAGIAHQPPKNVLPAESAPEAPKNTQQAGVAPKPPKNILPDDAAPESPNNTQQAGVTPKPPKNVLPDDAAPEAPKNIQQAGVAPIPTKNALPAESAPEAPKNIQQAGVAPQPTKNGLPTESSPESPKNSQQSETEPAFNVSQHQGWLQSARAWVTSKFEPSKGIQTNALPAESAPEAPKNTQQAGIAHQPPKNVLPAESAPEAPKNTQQAEIAPKPPKNVLPAESAPEATGPISATQTVATEPAQPISQQPVTTEKQPTLQPTVASLQPISYNQPNSTPEPMRYKPSESKTQENPFIQEPPISPAQIKARSALIATIRADLSDQGIQTEVDEAGGRIFLPQGLNFAYGSSKLPTQGIDDLRRLAKTLKKILPCHAKSKENLSCPQGKSTEQLDAILIDGFAHPADMNTIRFRYNWLLATSRSLQTFVTLTQDQPDLNTLKNGRDQSLFRITGHASPEARHHPKYLRRVELRFRMANP